MYKIKRHKPKPLIFFENVCFIPPDTVIVLTSFKVISNLGRKHENKHNECICLRGLSEALILIGSAMFGATFNLIKSVGLP